MHNPQRAPLMLGFVTALMMPLNVAHAADANWMKVADSKSKEVYLDLGSVRRAPDGAMWRGWLRFEFKSAVQVSPRAYMTSGKEIVQVDCQERTMQVLNAFWFDSTGAMVDQDGMGKVEFVAPESVGEGALDTICMVGATQDKLKGGSGKL